MLSLKQIATFQKEMVLGLGALALMLLGFGAAANWALWSHLSSSRTQAEVELTALALESVAGLERDLRTVESLESFIKAASGGEAALFIFERTSSRSRTSRAPAPIVNLVAQLDFSESATAAVINQNEYQYIREQYGEWELYHCPVFTAGKWKTLALVRECSQLAGLERAFTTLFWSALGILTLLLSAAITLFRSAAAPYQRIQTQAQSVGAHAVDAESAVEEIVEDYRRTIAELQNKETRLVELNQRLADHISDVERVNTYLLSSMSTGVLILDHQGSVVGINERAGEWLELDAIRECEDYVGLFAEEAELKSKIDIALTETQASEFDYELVRDGTESRTVGISLIPLTEEDGTLRELVALISDQTERVKAQKRLEDSRRLATLGEMSAGLAHQLRNSISAALGFGALAHKRIDDKVAAREDIDALIRELHEEAALIDRFLTYAKPLSISLESCELGGWLRQIISSAMVSERLNCEPIIEAPKAVCAEIDPLLLKQVVLNLIDNASKIVSEQDGEIIVSLRSDGDAYRIAVSDNGPGVPADDRELIFTPFYSSSPSGVGLGLPLARRIVALHGGRLSAEENAVGGAEFVITAPLRATEQAKAAFSEPLVRSPRST